MEDEINADGEINDYNEGVLKRKKAIAKFMGYTVYPNDAWIMPAAMSHIKEKDIPKYDEDLRLIISVLDKITKHESDKGKYWYTINVEEFYIQCVIESEQDKPGEEIKVDGGQLLPTLFYAASDFCLKHHK